MADKNVLSLTTPVGRLVSGSVYIEKTTDGDGKPMVIKTGPNAGQPRGVWDFGIAIPKTPGCAHWASEPWGAQIWAFGHQEFPQMAQRPDFSWKIADGDDAIPNKKGNKNCDKEGYPGHWVLYFSNSNAPAIYDAKGENRITEPDAVKKGFYVQVMVEYVSNAPSQTAGLYANHRAVALSAYGPIIAGGDVDVSKAGFGQAPLPAGAMTTPPAGVSAGTPPPPGTPAPPVAGTPPPPAAAVSPPAVVAPPVQAPPVVVPPVAAPAPPVVPAHDLVAQPAPVRVMLPAAGGAPYEAFIAQGWTDETLRANGYMQ